MFTGFPSAQSALIYARLRRKTSLLLYQKLYHFRSGERGTITPGRALMFKVSSNGTAYMISARRTTHPGWFVIGSADTLEEGYAKSKKDWDHYWELCGLTPSRQIGVSIA